MEERVAVRLLCFGQARELLSITSAEILLPKVSSKSEIVGQLEARFPDLARLQGCYVLAINQEYLGNVDTVRLSKGGDRFCFTVHSPVR
jgi:hypothetical protein